MKRISDEAVMSFVLTLSQMADNKFGVPPPRDDESYMSVSFVSSESSMLLDDISQISDLSEMKEKNFELRKNAKIAVKAFKSASKEFLSRSILTSDKKKLLVSELENVKNAIVSVADEGLYEGLADNMGKIHKQISEIQKEIQFACQQLSETEELLKITDEETRELQEKLKELDVSLNDINDEEENEECKCVIM